MRNATISFLAVAMFGLAVVSTLSKAEVKEGLTRYNVTIHTADSKGAGTNSAISIRFHNDEAYYSKIYRIDTPGDSFERNRWDIMLVNSPKDYGKITHVTLFSSNSGKAPGWLPEWVFVTNMDTGDRYVFKNFDEKFIGDVAPPEIKLKVAKTMKLSKKELKKFEENTTKALKRQRERAKGKSGYEQFREGLDEAVEISEDLGKIGKNLGSASQ
jgi:hypothetical protein